MATQILAPGNSDAASTPETLAAQALAQGLCVAAAGAAGLAASS